MGTPVEGASPAKETLAFLEQLGWVQSSVDDLQAAPRPLSRLARAHPGESARVFAEVLMDSPGPHRKAIAAYLGRFTSRDGELVYCPQGEQRLQESAVRNFLMELGAVAYRGGADHYVLSDGFAPLYLWAKNELGTADNATLEERNDNRHRLGFAAELEIVAFEQKRLGSPWAAEVQHVAAEFPAACYDIKSLSILGKFVSPRFIEVKAVSVDSLQFYWTASELEAARLLGASFFLYLLPVASPGTFDMDRLEVVQNPYVNVYQNPTAWSKNESVIVCRRSKTTTT